MSDTPGPGAAPPPPPPAGRDSAGRDWPFKWRIGAAVVLGVAVVGVVVAIAVSGDDDPPDAAPTPTQSSPSSPAGTPTPTTPPPTLTPTPTPTADLDIPPLLVEGESSSVLLVDVVVGDVVWDGLLDDLSTLSPNGSAFARFDPGDAVSPPSVELTDLASGSQSVYEVPRQPSDIFMGSAYDWSPDAQFLAYLDETGENVHIVATGSGATTTFGISGSPTSEWSPASTHVLVCVDEADRTELTLAAAGGEPVVISEDNDRWEGVDCDWRWSTDGAYVTIMVDGDVLTFRADDASRQRIDGLPADVEDVELTRCAGIDGEADAVVRGFLDDAWSFYAIDAGAASAERVNTPCDAAVSPDGESWAWVDEDDDELLIGETGQGVDSAVSPAQPGTRVEKIAWLKSGELLFDAEGGLFAAQADGSGATSVETPDRVDSWWYYPEADRVVVHGDDYTVVLDPALAEIGALDSVAWNPDGRQAVSADGRFLALSAVSEVPVVDLTDASLVTTVDLSAFEEFGSVRFEPLDWLPD